MDRETIENGFVQVIGSKIGLVGSMEQMPKLGEKEIIDGLGRVLIPGMIDAHCHLGMWEDSLGFEGADGNEINDPTTPQLRGIDAINPVDRCFTEAAEAGVTTVITGPGSANAIGGQLAAVKTAGGRIDDMIVRAPVAMKFAFGENPKRCYQEKSSGPMTRMATAAITRNQLFKAQNYMLAKEKAEAEGAKAPDFDFKCEALIPVLKRQLPAHIHAHRADDIFSAIRVAKEFNLDYVLVHCTEGHMIAGQLAEEGVSAITGPMICDRPKPEVKNHTIKNPGALAGAGVATAIATDHPVIPIQYLPISAALAVREGMPYMKALAAITLEAARICRIDDRLGSITTGKDADLVLFQDDPLSVYSKPELVLINGKKVGGNQ